MPSPPLSLTSSSGNDDFAHGETVRKGAYASEVKRAQESSVIPGQRRCRRRLKAEHQRQGSRGIEPSPVTALRMEAMKRMAGDRTRQGEKDPLPGALSPLRPRRSPTAWASERRRISRRREMTAVGFASRSRSRRLLRDSRGPRPAAVALPRGAALSPHTVRLPGLRGRAAPPRGGRDRRMPSTMAAMLRARPVLPLPRL
jgi:hypothetical protein